MAENSTIFNKETLQWTQPANPGKLFQIINHWLAFGHPEKLIVYKKKVSQELFQKYKIEKKL